MVYSGGRYVNYRYNAEGSLAELDYGEGDAAPTATYRFEYDSLGRLIRSQQRDGNTVTQRTEQLYDTANRLSAQGWTIGGTSYRESYAYDASDGSLTTLNTAVGTRIGYNYDALKRLRSRAVYQGSTPLFENRYAYATQSGNQSTALVEFFNYRLASDDGNGDIIVGYQYEYDKGGNITDIKAEVDGALIPLEHYEYDEKQGQLKTAIRYENGEEADRWTYSYDTAGNILSEDHEGSNSELHEYAYENERWGDLLTSVDGIDLEYDGSGNPMLYANGTELLWNMEWQNGRQLSRASTERDSTTEDVLDFAYDANGIRTRKTVTRNTYRPVQTYKVTFVADGKTVKTMNVTEGYTLKDSDYPAVPEKAGYTGAWQRYPSPVKSNVTVSATYTRLTAQYTVTFLADGFTVKTMQVYSGYVLKDSDYPSVPEKVGYTGHWNKITAPITKNTFVYAVYYSTDPTHIVTFYFAGEDYGTLTVDDGYILQDCDYPELPTRDGYTAYWDTYTQPIRKDITVTGNWEENAIIPPQPTDPPEIMSGDASEPVEAGAEAYASGALVSTETVTHEYLTQSGKIVREVITAPTETTTLDFFYDESGRPFAFNYSVDGDTASTYYYILNLQGDVVQIIDANGVMQAEYVYSPWGEIISAEGDLAEINPLRYRGYYYDSETGFYYLQSRYYDPENHRFINADTYASTDSSDAIACNMFAYCGNNPIAATDPGGEFFLTALIVGAVVGAVVGGAIGGTAAYNSAKSSGAEGSDLFWATARGVGKGAVIGGAVGGLAGATYGVVTTYGIASVAGTAMVTTSATTAAKTVEVVALQTRKSYSDGDRGWQVVNDCVDSVFDNGLKVGSSTGTKALSTVGSFFLEDIAKHKVVPLEWDTFIKSSKSNKSKIGACVGMAYAWANTVYAFFCDDPVARAAKRGYTLK